MKAATTDLVLIFRVQGGREGQVLYEPLVLCRLWQNNTITTMPAT